MSVVIMIVVVITFYRPTTNTYKAQDSNTNEGPHTISLNILIDKSSYAQGLAHIHILSLPTAS